MSGGGSKKEERTPGPGEYPGGPEGPVMRSPGAMPGQNEAIAQQLAMGFSGIPQATILQQMNRLYAPMDLPDFRPDDVRTPKKKKKGLLEVPEKKPKGLLDQPVNPLMPIFDEHGRRHESRGGM